MRKPWAVVDCEPKDKHGRLKVLKRFKTEAEGAEWISKQPDKAKIDRGGYGLDGPEGSHA